MSAKNAKNAKEAIIAKNGKSLMIGRNAKMQKSKD